MIDDDRITQRTLLGWCLVGVMFWVFVGLALAMLG